MIKLKPWEALPVYISISNICLTVARKNGMLAQGLHPPRMWPASEKAREIGDRHVDVLIESTGMG